MRSESRPHTGAKRNCISENDDISKPVIAPTMVAFCGKIGLTYDSAMRGNKGSTMPNPSRSMNTTRKTIIIAERLERVSVAGASGVGVSAVCILITIARSTELFSPALPRQAGVTPWKSAMTTDDPFFSHCEGQAPPAYLVFDCESI